MARRTSASLIKNTPIIKDLRFRADARCTNELVEMTVEQMCDHQVGRPKSLPYTDDSMFLDCMHINTQVARLVTLLL
jgi:hypothetical protein